MMKATIFILAAFLCGSAYCTDATTIQTNITSKINEFVKNFSNLLKEILDDILTPVLALVKNALSLVKQTVSTVTNLLNLGFVADTLINPLLTQIEEGLTGLFKIGDTMTSHLTNGLSMLLDPVFKLLATIVSTISGMSGSASKCAEGIEIYLTGLIATLGTESTQCLTPIKSAHQTLIKDITDSLNDVIDNLKKSLKSVTDCQGVFKVFCLGPALMNIVPTTLNSVFKLVTSLPAKIMSNLATSTNVMTTCLSSPMNIVTDGFEGVSSTLTTCINGFIA